MTMNTHCHHCGAHQGAIRKCSGCQGWTYLNPLPVAVALVPVPTGLVTIRRGRPEDPGYGKLALPGGFIGLGETWQEALAREVLEEVDVVVVGSQITLFDVVSTPRNVLIFGKVADLINGLGDHTPSPLQVAQGEVLETVIITEPIDLAFPAHTDVVRRYFERTSFIVQKAR